MSDHMTEDSVLKKTIRDPDNPTIRDTLPEIRSPDLLHLKDFRGFHIGYTYPATGGEADIYRSEKDDQTYILKIYREGIYPNEEVSKKIQQISVQFPDNFVRLIDYGLDSSTNRWFEIQEYVTGGSLKDLLERESTGPSQIQTIIQKISQTIALLHRNQILHLDLKPANILIRSHDPLDLVLTDFSVSSILPDKLSQRMTTRKGTPLYWAPEQLSGVVGKEADYWALGIIVLEILNKTHPFEGLDHQVVMWTLSTKGIEIPQNIPEEYSLLLKGLLTREPKKRWGEGEIKEWLQGKRDIPVYYDYVIDDESQKNIKPYPFQGKRYYSIESLVAAFIESPENWENAKMHLGRGYILKWLENNGEYDHAIFFESNKDTNLDKKLFNLIYSKNNSLPFCVLGKVIDESNLYLFLGKVLRKENGKFEDKIIDFLKNGELLAYTHNYEKLTGKCLDVLEIILSKSDISEIFTLLDLLNYPEKYVIPDIASNKDMVELLQIFSSPVRDNVCLLPITLGQLDTLKSKYIIPGDLINNLRIKTKFRESIYILKQLTEQGLTKVEFEDLKERYIIPDFIQLDLYKNDTFLITCQKLKSISRIGFTKEELTKLEEQYIIPKTIKKQFNSENFLNAYNDLKNLKSTGALFQKRYTKKI